MGVWVTVVLIGAIALPSLARKKKMHGSEAIGEGVVETLKKYPKSPAVLMQNHGPFTIGKDAESAVKAAAMTEEVAHTMWAARQLGEIIPISDEDIAKLNDRYTNVYGQH